MENRKLKFQIANNTESLRDALMIGKIAIWTGQSSLHEAIESATDEMSSQAKIRVRACRNQKFSKPVEYRKGGRKITEFKDLGDFLINYGESLDNDDVFIVKSNDYVELFELMQQFINIGLHPKVYTFEDFIKKETTDEFFKLTDKIKENCEDLKKFLSEQTDQSIKDTRDNLKKSIEKIEKLVNESKKNLITVAVFATKKTGKSMVVNCLVKDEFAPTSQELPTPNNIIYMPVNVNKARGEIVLHYNNEKRRFSDAKEIRKFIRTEFKKVEKSGKKIPDMKIEYPTEDPLSFEIVDTPGPDLAGSEHASAIDKVISNTDIAIFIIDYSKYAQDSEVALFKSVKEYFEKLGKQHSFICLVNKYDLIYQDTDSEKVMVRVSDFIREKLKHLGFDRFVVIPVSAITWFYLYKISERFPEVVQQKDIRRYLEDEIEDLIKDEEDFRTIIAFIQNLANHIRSTYQIKNPTYRDVLEISNFEIFFSYLIDITNDKAKVEKIFSYISQIDSLIVEITNLIEGTKKLNKAQRDKIIGELSKFQRELEEAVKNYIEKEAKKKIDEIQRRYTDFLSSSSDEIVKRTKYSFREIVDIEFSGLLTKISKDVDFLKREKISRDDFVNKYKIMKISINPKLDISGFIGNSQLIQKNLRELTISVNNALESFDKEMKDKINVLSSTLKREFNIDFKFSAPNIELYFDFEFIKKQISKYSERMISHSITLGSEFFDKIIEGGFLRWLGSFFGGDRYKVKEEEIHRKVNELKERVKAEADSIVRSIEYDLRETAKKNENEFMTNISHQTDKISAYLNSVKESSKKIIEILNMDVNKIELIIQMFDRFTEKLNPLRSIWSELMDNYHRRKSTH